MFKVCIKIGQEICGGVRDEVFFGLTARDFIKLSRVAHGRGLTNIQFDVLWGVGKLGKVYAVTGNEISKTSGVHNSVSIQKAVDRLIKIEVIYKDNDAKGDFVTIDDVFLKLWLLKIKESTVKF